MNLRDYQIQQLQKNYELIEQKKTNIFIFNQAPTGSGKSILIFQLINYLFLRDKNTCNILILTPRQELNENIARFFKIIPPNLTIETNLKKTNKNNNYDYIIIDEVHHSNCKTYQNKVKKYKPSIVFGFSATPPKKPIVFENYTPYYIECALQIKQLIEQNYLCAYAIHIVDTINDHILNETRLLNNKTQQELTFAHIVNLIDPYKIQHIIDICIGQTVVFCLNNEHIEHIKKYFIKKNFAILTSSSSLKERKEIIKNFEQKKIQFILSINIFIEGIDIPCIENLIFLRPTSSLNYYLQSIGRGLRFDKNNPKKIVNIFDFVANCSYFGEPKNIVFSNPYKNTKKLYEKQKLLLDPIICVCPKCKKEIDRYTKMCPHCFLNIEKYKWNKAKTIYLNKIIKILEKIQKKQQTIICDAKNFTWKKIYVKNRWAYIFNWQKINLFFYKDLYFNTLKRFFDFQTNELKNVKLFLCKKNLYYKIEKIVEI